MLKILFRPLIVLLLFVVLTGIAYPLVITGLGQALFPKQANGSIILKDGKPIGSELIAQPFNNDNYFHGRPSAVDQIAASSSGSNLGPTSAKMMDSVKERVAVFEQSNPSFSGGEIPADLALASGSGLDPHISTDAAIMQAERIAQVRKIDKERVVELVKSSVEPQQFGILGASRVNVLKLNVALDYLGEAVAK